MKITKEKLLEMIEEEMAVLEQEDANKQIDNAQKEAQKIAIKLVQELEAVSGESGIDPEILANLVSQFIDQEVK